MTDSALPAFLRESAPAQTLSQVPTWACPRCGSLLPIVHPALFAATHEFHLQEHTVTDLMAALATCTAERKALEHRQAGLDLKLLELSGEFGEEVGPVS